MHETMLRMLVMATTLRRDDEGVTTVEWLGMAAVVVLVIAFLLPQVRTASANMWTSIVGEMDGLFG